MTNPCDAFDPSDCEKSVPCIVQYLDDCPKDVECQKIIKALVERCPRCEETYLFEMRVRQVVSKRCSDQVPAALKAKIVAVIRQSHVEP